MDIMMAVHICRNPEGHTEAVVRDARDFVFCEVERLNRGLDRAVTMIEPIRDCPDLVISRECENHGGDRRKCREHWKEYLMS